MNENLLKDFNEQRERLYNEIEELEKERDKWKDKYWDLEDEIANNKLEQTNIELQTKICKAISYMNNYIKFEEFNEPVKVEFGEVIEILKGGE